MLPHTTLYSFGPFPMGLGCLGLGLDDPSNQPKVFTSYSFDGSHIV